MHHAERESGHTCSVGGALETPSCEREASAVLRSVFRMQPDNLSNVVLEHCASQTEGEPIISSSCML